MIDTSELVPRNYPFGDAFPHLAVFGGNEIVREDDDPRKDLISVSWHGLFVKVGTDDWRCIYYDNGSDTPFLELMGEGDTPRKAFDALWRKWTIANGAESTAMRQMKPKLFAQLGRAGLTE